MFGTGRDTNGDRARSVATDTVSWRYTAKGILEKKGNIGIKRKGELPESLPSPGSRILNQVQKRKGKWWRQKFSARAWSVQTNTFCPAKKSTLEIHNHPHRHQAGLFPAPCSPGGTLNHSPMRTAHTSPGSLRRSPAHSTYPAGLGGPEELGAAAGWGKCTADYKKKTHEAISDKGEVLHPCQIAVVGHIPLGFCLLAGKM